MKSHLWNTENIQFRISVQNGYRGPFLFWLKGSRFYSYLDETQSQNHSKCWWRHITSRLCIFDLYILTFKVLRNSLCQIPKPGSLCIRIKNIILYRLDYKSLREGVLCFLQQLFLICGRDHRKGLQDGPRGYYTSLFNVWVFSFLCAVLCSFFTFQDSAHTRAPRGATCGDNFILRSHKFKGWQPLTRSMPAHPLGLKMSTK